MLSYLALFTLATTVVNALTIPGLLKKSTPEPLKLDFTVSHTVGNETAREFWQKIGTARNSKRGSYPEIITDSKDVTYLINLYLGSDQQEVTVTLDTGSSDLWTTSDYYTPGTSASDTGEPFTIGYADGSGANGEYYTDTLAFSTDGSAPVLNNFQFALVDQNSNAGILGIADKNQEASQSPYDNLPWALQAQGLTPKASYSLFLGPDNGLGSVIFGGIDTDKYTGLLTKYPIAGNGLGITLESFDINGDTINAGEAYILDSGTSLGFVSQEIQDQLDAVFNPTDYQQGAITYKQVSCDQPTDKYVTINFGLSLLKFSYAELINHEPDACFLGFASYGDYRILGDVFLRKAYVYYDLTDQSISLGEALYSSSSNIISA